QGESLTLFLNVNRKKKGIHMIRVKHFARPEQCHHLILSNICNRMRISWQNVNHLIGTSSYRKLFHRSPLNRPHPDQPVTLYNKELIRLGVVIVISACDPGLGSRNEYLPKVLCFDEFGQTATVVGLDVEIVLQLLGGDIRKDGCIERAAEPG